MVTEWSIVFWLGSWTMQFPLLSTFQLEQQTKQTRVLEADVTFCQSELLLLLQQIEIIKNADSSTIVNHWRAFYMTPVRQFPLR
jgi:hypothetical protein